MADNFPFTPGTGLTGSADDIGGGVLVQRVKVQYGADGSATDVAPGVGLPVAGQYAEVAGTAAALNADALASTDVRGYSRFSVQFSGTWTGTFNIQGSNDNTNWFTYFNVWAISGTGSPTANISSNGIYNGVITARYLRVRMLAYTSGTATVTTELSNTPGDPNVSINSGAALSCSVSSPSSASDGATVSTSQVQVSPALYNGSTMDRLRSFGVQGAAGVSPVAGTSGGWLPALYTALTNTVVAVKNSSVGQFGGYMIYNPHATAAAYVQVFDAATAGTPTLGTTTPKLSFPIPPASAANVEITCGLAFSNGIQIAATLTSNGSGAPSSALVANIFYK